MDHDTFVAHYIATWLATLSANGYQRRCVLGIHYTANMIPAEDAFMEAEMAWEAVNRITPGDRVLARDLAK